MARFRGFFTKKRLLWGGIALLLVAGIGAAMNGGNGGEQIETETVKRQDLRRTVLSTGQVVSSVDLSLGFQASGVVRQVLVKEGSRVGAGQTLALLDQGAARAALATAQGALAQTQANYDKILAGASSQDVEVSKAAVKAAETTLSNAYSTLLNSGLAAIPATTNSSAGTITVGGTYTGNTEGKITIAIYGDLFDAKGLATAYERFVRGVPVPIGSQGLYLTFSSTGSFLSGDSWVISIPNTQASTYLANLNAYQAAQSALEQAKAALALKQAAARPEDLAAAQAAILSAEGQVASAQVTLNNTVLSAPSAGTITDVNIRVGEQATALSPVIVLQDVGNLHAEADVSEADIASVTIGQEVDYTFDALGPDRHFKGLVRTVNPASTVISGIVNYKVTANILDAPEIKPGMTANMTVLVATRQAVLAVPANAVFSRDGKKYVRVVDDADTKTYRETEVQTGLNADGGAVEILAGLSEGQEIVTDLRG